MERAVCWPHYAEGKVSELSSFHSNLLFPPFCPFVHLHQDYRIFIHSNSVNIPSAQGHQWKEQPLGMIFAPSHQSTLTWPRGETDSSVITDPLVTIIKPLICDVLRRFHNLWTVWLLPATRFAAASPAADVFVQGQSCMIAVLDCYWMSLSIHIRNWHTDVLYIRLLQSFPPVCFKDPLDLCIIHP